MGGILLHFEHRHAVCSEHINEHIISKPICLPQNQTSIAIPNRLRTSARRAPTQVRDMLSVVCQRGFKPPRVLTSQLSATCHSSEDERVITIESGMAIARLWVRVPLGSLQSFLPDLSVGAHLPNPSLHESSLFVQLTLERSPFV